MTAPLRRKDLPSPLALLRSVPALRGAAFGQAVAVAAFMGWLLFPAASHAPSAALAALVTAARLRPSGSPAYAAMTLLGVGTQVALITNQARAQAAAPTVPVCDRLAAIMTTIAFGGGTAGAAIGSLMRRWQRQIAFTDSWHQS